MADLYGEERYLSKFVRTAVYLIAPDPEGPCKIGVATNPLSRLAALQVGYPEKLSIFGLVWFHSRLVALRAEAALLKHYDSWRLTGEWIGHEAWDVNGSLRGLVDRYIGLDYVADIEYFESCDPPGYDPDNPIILTAEEIAECVRGFRK